MSTTTYVWELGIDWNAIKDEKSTGTTSYLGQGLVRQYPLGLASAMVNNPETIRFRIFDVTADGPRMAGLNDFSIVSRAAVEHQSPQTGLTDLQLTVDPLGLQLSTNFGGSFPAWDLGEVTVLDLQGRFLLTFEAKVYGLAGGPPRTFLHDPEMVVGPNM
jgi:hypothetical protein